MLASQFVSRRAAAAVAAVLLGLPAARADVITNGGFEAGFAGWVRADQLGSEGTFFSQAGTASPLGGDPVPPPPAGLRAAMTDAFGPGAHVLYQDFVVPTTSAARLQFSLFVGNRGPAFFTPATLDFATPALNQQARVDILRAGTDPFSTAPADVLLTAYRTQVGDPPVSGYTAFDVDVQSLFAANAGQTLRLRFAETDNVNAFQFGVDNVGVATAVPEPATAAVFGACLLAAAGRVRRAARGRRATT